MGSIGFILRGILGSDYPKSCVDEWSSQSLGAAWVPRNMNPTTMPHWEPIMPGRRYTFESDGHGRMGKRWRSRSECIRAMVEWLEVCAQNDFYPSVKLIVLEPSQ